ncbi:MAG: translation initiation factor IF-2 subunit gamma [archaeon]
MPKKKAEPKEKKPKKAKKPKAKAEKKETASKKITKKAGKEAGTDTGQPSVNIGLVGHVDHGKTTLTEALSGKWTDTHSEELKRGITIRLGYADASFYYCKKCKEYRTAPRCLKCKGTPEFVRKVSFVDAPGHESLMATMLAGATIMDGALLLIAANEVCPQPQTREHLMALQITGIKKVIILQNKVDLVDEERAMRNYKQIKEFLKNTEYKDAPIIPISAQHKVNIDMVIDAIEEYIPTPERNIKEDPVMLIARSFDINKPGAKPKDLQGGILGGAIVKGKLKVGDRVEIKPGRIVEEQNQIKAKSLFTEIIGIMTGGASVKEAVPGGSIGILTKLDSNIVKSDSLTGNLVGLPDKLPDVWYNLKLMCTLLERVVGSKEELKVEPIKMNEILMLNINSAATVGFVTDLSKDSITCKLKLPICAEKGARITISRRIDNRFRLIGYGIIEG